jgi:hypothetical protein
VGSQHVGLGIDVGQASAWQLLAEPLAIQTLMASWQDASDGSQQLALGAIGRQLLTAVLYTNPVPHD